MQHAFDWLRICKTGGELLSTLDLLSDEPDLPSIIAKEDRLGVPQTAFDGSCLRCRYYTRLTNTHYCYFCNHVMTRESIIRPFARHSVILWGFVNHSPIKMPQTKFDIFYNILDEKHFICCTNRWHLKSFLQEIGLSQGPDWLGLIQIFPVFAGGETTTMSDILCSAVHEEKNIMLNQLYIQFYATPYQLFTKKDRDREGKLTFTMSEFIGYLEMAEIFKRGLYLEEQDRLLEVLNLKDPTEKQFYWGRFIGQIRSEARDFLDSWNMRLWVPEQVSLFYELLDFAKFDPDKCISNMFRNEE
ncbi:MAG: hypothetical protein HQK75_04125 [Candidatus Magnetomorum sp.]|nr:hypothetical protein [Candidatus Magnetomorum sp.]